MKGNTKTGLILGIGAVGLILLNKNSSAFNDIFSSSIFGGTDETTEQLPNSKTIYSQSQGYSTPNEVVNYTNDNLNVGETKINTTPTDNKNVGENFGLPDNMDYAINLHSIKPREETTPIKDFFKGIGGVSGVGLGLISGITSPLTKKTGEKLATSINPKIILQNEQNIFQKLFKKFGSDGTKTIKGTTKDGASKTFLKKIGSSVGEVGLKSLPFVGWAGGITYDMTKDNRKFGEAFISNTLGDVLGTATGLLTAPSGAGAIAVSVGTQLGTEYGTYKASDLIERKLGFDVSGNPNIKSEVDENSYLGKLSTNYNEKSVFDRFMTITKIPNFAFLPFQLSSSINKNVRNGIFGKKDKVSEEEIEQKERSIKFDIFSHDIININHNAKPQPNKNTSYSSETKKDLNLQPNTEKEVVKIDNKREDERKDTTNLNQPTEQPLHLQPYEKTRFKDNIKNKLKDSINIRKKLTTLGTIFK